MPKPSDFLPMPPWEGLPIPRNITLYHVTLKSNLPSIFEKGLLPLETDPTGKTRWVNFYPDYMGARNWAMAGYLDMAYPNDRVIILRVRIPRLWTAKMKDWGWVRVPFTVPPEHIVTCETFKPTYKELEEFEVMKTDPKLVRWLEKQDLISK